MSDVQADRDVLARVTAPWATINAGNEVKEWESQHAANDAEIGSRLYMKDSASVWIFACEIDDKGSSI